MKIEASIVSDIGLCRQNNEDNFYMNGFYRDKVEINHIQHETIYDQKDFLCAVFDGMGGEKNGEIASLNAAEILKKYQRAKFRQISDQYIMEANKKVCEIMKELNIGRMGSTLAVAKIHKNQMSICNVGDSPIYLFRDSVLEQLSVNHNEAQSLFDMGMMTREELKTSKRKHRLTQHLGIFEDEMIIEPYIQENIQLLNNDFILLCSDGLTDMVEDEEIQYILQEKTDVQKKAAVLVDTALENGGRDNVTVVLLHIV